MISLSFHQTSLVIVSFEAAPLILFSARKRPLSSVPRNWNISLVEFLLGIFPSSTFGWSATVNLIICRSIFEDSTFLFHCQTCSMKERGTLWFIQVPLGRWSKDLAQFSWKKENVIVFGWIEFCSQQLIYFIIN